VGALIFFLPSWNLRIDAARMLSSGYLAGLNELELEQDSCMHRHNSQTLTLYDFVIYIRCLVECSSQYHRYCKLRNRD
jgi:hypothetical protein